MKKKCAVIECGLSSDDIEVEPVRLGRPTKWSDEDEFIKAVSIWVRKRKIRMDWKYVKGVGMIKLPDPKPLSIASLCHHLGISTRTFYRWRKNENHPLFEICEQVMVAIEADLWDQDSEVTRLNLQCNFVRSQRARVRA